MIKKGNIIIATKSSLLPSVMLTSQPAYPPGHHRGLSVTGLAAISRILCIWNHPTCTLSCLATFTQSNYSENSPSILSFVLTVHSFLLLSSISFHGYHMVC